MDIDDIRLTYLPQGGLELPCALTFTTASDNECTKAKKLFESMLSIKTREAKSEDKPVEDEIKELTHPCHSSSSGTVKVEGKDDDKDEEMTNEPACLIDQTGFVKDKIVQSPEKKRSKVIDTEGIVMGKDLSDSEINFAQHLLKMQFTKLNGLQSTLFQDKQLELTENETKNKIQIIHCNSRHHWIVATTVDCALNQVKIYNSLFTHCDEETDAVISNLFKCNSEKLVITVSRSQKQKGIVDCGLFAIANATVIAFGKSPSKPQFI